MKILIISLLLTLSSLGKENVNDFTNVFEHVAFIVKGRDGSIQSIYLLKGKKENIRNSDIVFIQKAINRKVYKKNNYFIILKGMVDKELWFVDRAYGQREGKSMADFFQSWKANRSLPLKVKKDNIQP